MTDFAWLDEIEEWNKANHQDEYVDKLIETVKVMREALLAIDKLDCNYCSDIAQAALEKCK